MATAHQAAGTPGLRLATAQDSLSELPLLTGWNLLSLPKQPADPSPGAVFGGSVARVFTYDACNAADPWKVWDRADPSGSDLTSIDHKAGFWLEAGQTAAQPVAGTEPATTTIHLCPGWNLVGYPVPQERPVAGALASIAGKYTRVFGYDPFDPADPWEIFDVSVPAWANDLQALQPGRGYWILATAETDLVFTSTVGAPVVQIASPFDLSEVTTFAPIVGTVTSDLLEEWTLSYRAAGETAWTRIAGGTTPVVNASLGTFDPTLLLNGLYEVQLAATDANGQESAVEIGVSVEGRQKIGHFTLQFIDLEIPLSGLPIEVVRQYDSRDKSQGDFGVGWNIELRQGSYRNNRKPGDGWRFASGFLPCQNIQETRSHATTIRLSDQEVYRFELALSSPAPTLGGCFGQARFNYVDGPFPGATLAILGNTEVIYQNDTDYVVDSGSLEIYEPQAVRLTTPDGRTFDLDLAQGVTRLQDLNGNSLSITPSGIAHSGGMSVSFVRDAQGRITSITDPEGNSLFYEYDSAGDLVSVEDRGSNVTRFTYEAGHRLLSIEDPLGRQPIRNEYDESGRLIRTTDAAGKSIELTHQIDERREVISDRLGRTRILEYDERGNVVREVDTNGKVTLRTFNADDQLLSETDPLGHTTSYSYDAAQNVTAVTDPLGNVTRYTYDARNEVLTVTDPRGKVTTNTYDSYGNLLSKTDPLGNTTTFTYDSRGYLLSETDGEGNDTQYQFDGRGLLLSETDPLGKTTTYTYDGNGNQLTRTTTRTTSQGTETLTWSYAYDGLGRITRTTDPDGTTTETAYDFRGNVTEVVDKKGRRTTYTYDGLGRLLQTSYPDGTAETSAYDAEGRRISSADRAGRTTTYTYDPLGRLLTSTYPDGGVLTNIYDDAGRLTETRDARNNPTRYEYDAAGRRTRVVNALDQAMTFAYDAVGNQISVTDAEGNTTQFEYDDAGRLVRVVHPDGTDQATGYDRAGRRTTVTDQAGKVTRFGYDGRGRLVTVTDALSQITSYAYDELGNRTTQTDANGHVTRFEHDRLGRMTKRTLPDGTAESFVYDEAGNPIRRTDFTGAATTYSYDANDRLLSRSYPDGTSVSFTYTATGQRETAADSRGMTGYTYDGRDRLTGMTYPDGRRLLYTYDPQGNRTSLTAVVGGVTLATGYTYDALNRLENVTDPLGKVYAHTYDANGNRASVRYPNGVVTSYGYDALNRLLTLSSSHTVAGVFQSFFYTLGPAGNRTRVDEHGGTAREYVFDPLYRLTQETVSRSGVLDYQGTFTYDPVGNRLQQERTAEGTTTLVGYAYDDRDRLLTEGSTTYGWDANGNRTGKSGPDGATYVWDHESRLIQVQLANGTVVEHTYDADGNRVRTKVTPATGPPQVTDYLVDPQHGLTSRDRAAGLSQVVAATDAAGALTSYLVRGDDLLAVLRPVAGSPGTFAARYFHADGLGSIRALTDDSGAVADTYEFSAFGELLARTGSDPNAYLFAGEPFDPNTGFYYLRARWMDPALGAFTALDPAAGRLFEPATLHKYLYAGADPVDNVDPSGREFSLPSTMTSLAMSASLALSNLSGQLRAAFAQGGPVLGRLFNALGTTAQRYVRLTIELYGRVNLKEDVAVGARYIDFYLSRGGLKAWLEVKYSMPRAGAALTRLVAQVQAALATGEGQVVVWTYRVPSPTQMQAVLNALGSNASSVRFIHGYEALYRWLVMYFGG